MTGDMIKKKKQGFSKKNLILSFLAPGSIFVEQLRQEVVSFVFRVAQTFFVPNFYIPLI